MTVLIPTLDLRILKRVRERPELGGGIVEDEAVLQQRFTRPSGVSIWQDIPIVTEGETNG
jgi:hypothetical protein